MKCYIVSGFFNPSQIEEIERIKNILNELDIEYFSPKDDNLIKPDDSEEKRMKGVRRNLDEIERSDFIVVNTNNYDPGSLVECGYAKKADIPIIFFCQGLKGNFNLMLANLGMCVTTSYNELLKAIKRFLNEGRFYEEYKGKIE